MNQRKPFKTFIASLTVFVFFVTSLGINPEALAAAVTPEVTLPFQVKLGENLHMAIPRELGKLEHFKMGQGPAIFHIQTAHGHYEAQQQIRRILHHLSKNYGIRTILVEGSAFKLKPEILNFFPKDHKLTMKVNDELTKHALVKGPELFLLDEIGVTPQKKNGGVTPISAYGIEQVDLYRENGYAFVDVLNQKEKTQDFLANMNEGIERLSAPYLNDTLRTFLKREEAFEKNLMPMDAWLSYLKEQAQKNLKLDLANVVSQVEWPMLVRIFKIRELSSKLDQKAFLMERNEFLKVLKQFIPQSGVRDSYLDEEPKRVPRSESLFAEIEHLLRSEQQSQQLPDPETGLLFEDMVKHLPKDFNYGAFPNVRYFIGTLLLQSELKASLLMGEVRRLTDRITDRLARSKTEKDLIGLLKDYRLLQKLFALELVPQDYDTLLAHKRELQPSRIVGKFNSLNGTGYEERNTEKKFDMPHTIRRTRAVEFTHISDLNQLFDSAMKFYEGVKARDGAMEEMIEKRLKETGADKVAVITGGFHSEPFQNYFGSKDYTYALISPKITGADKQGYNEYVRNILDQTLRPVKSSTRESVSAASSFTELKDMGVNPVAFARAELRAASHVIENPSDAQKFALQLKNRSEALFRTESGKEAAARAEIRQKNTIQHMLAIGDQAKEVRDTIRAYLEANDNRALTLKNWVDQWVRTEAPDSNLYKASVWVQQELAPLSQQFLDLPKTFRMISATLELLESRNKPMRQMAAKTLLGFNDKKLTSLKLYLEWTAVPEKECRPLDEEEILYIKSQWREGKEIKIEYHEIPAVSHKNGNLSGVEVEDVPAKLEVSFPEGVRSEMRTPFKNVYLFSGRQLSKYPMIQTAVRIIKILRNSLAVFFAAVKRFFKPLLAPLAVFVTAGAVAATVDATGAMSSMVVNGFYAAAILTGVHFVTNLGARWLVQEDYDPAAAQYQGIKTLLRANTLYGFVTHKIRQAASANKILAYAGQYLFLTSLSIGLMGLSPLYAPYFVVSLVTAMVIEPLFYGMREEVFLTAVARIFKTLFAGLLVVGTLALSGTTAFLITTTALLITSDFIETARAMGHLDNPIMAGIYAATALTGARFITKLGTRWAYGPTAGEYQGIINTLYGLMTYSIWERVSRRIWPQTGSKIFASAMQYLYVTVFSVALMGISPVYFTFFVIGAIVLMVIEPLGYDLREPEKKPKEITSQGAISQPLDKPSSRSEVRLTPAQEKQFQKAMKDLQPRWADDISLFGFIGFGASRRAVAAKTLGELKDTRAVPALIDALEDWTPEVRKSARKALNTISPQGLAQLKRYFDWVVARSSDYDLLSEEDINFIVEQLNRGAIVEASYEKIPEQEHTEPVKMIAPGYGFFVKFASQEPFVDQEAKLVVTINKTPAPTLPFSGRSEMRISNIRSFVRQLLELSEVYFDKATWIQTLESSDSFEELESSQRNYFKEALTAMGRETEDEELEGIFDDNKEAILTELKSPRSEVREWLDGLTDDQKLQDALVSVMASKANRNNGKIDQEFSKLAGAFNQNGHFTENQRTQAFTLLRSNLDFIPQEILPEKSVPLPYGDWARERPPSGRSEVRGGRVAEIVSAGLLAVGMPVFYGAVAFLITADTIETAMTTGRLDNPIMAGVYVAMALTGAHFITNLGTKWFIQPGYDPTAVKYEGIKTLLRANTLYGLMTYSTWERVSRRIWPQTGSKIFASAMQYLSVAVLSVILMALLPLYFTYFVAFLVTAMVFEPIFYDLSEPEKETFGEAKNTAVLRKRDSFSGPGFWARLQGIPAMQLLHKEVLEIQTRLQRNEIDLKKAKELIWELVQKAPGIDELMSSSDKETIASITGRPLAFGALGTRYRALFERLVTQAEDYGVMWQGYERRWRTSSLLELIDWTLEQIKANPKLSKSPTPIEQRIIAFKKDLQRAARSKERSELRTESGDKPATVRAEVRSSWQESLVRPLAMVGSFGLGSLTFVQVAANEFAKANTDVLGFSMAFAGTVTIGLIGGVIAGFASYGIILGGYLASDSVVRSVKSVLGLPLTPQNRLLRKTSGVFRSRSEVRSSWQESVLRPAAIMVSAGLGGLTFFNVATYEFAKANVETLGFNTTFAATTAIGIIAGIMAGFALYGIVFGGYLAMGSVTRAVKSVLKRTDAGADQPLVDHLASSAVVQQAFQHYLDTSMPDQRGEALEKVARAIVSTAGADVLSQKDFNAVIKPLIMQLGLGDRIIWNEQIGAITAKVNTMASRIAFQEVTGAKSRSETRTIDVQRFVRELLELSEVYFEAGEWIEEFTSSDSFEELPSSYRGYFEEALRNIGKDPEDVDVEKIFNDNKEAILAELKPRPNSVSIEEAVRTWTNWTEVPDEVNPIRSPKETYIIREKILGDNVLRIYSGKEHGSFGIQLWKKIDVERYDVNTLFSMRWFGAHNQWILGAEAAVMKSEQSPEVKLFFDNAKTILYVIFPTAQNVADLRELGVEDTSEARIFAEEQFKAVSRVRSELRDSKPVNQGFWLSKPTVTQPPAQTNPVNQGFWLSKPAVTQPPVQTNPVNQGFRLSKPAVTQSPAQTSPVNQGFWLSKPTGDPLAKMIEGLPETVRTTLKEKKFDPVDLAKALGMIGGLRADAYKAGDLKLAGQLREIEITLLPRKTAKLADFEQDLRSEMRIFPGLTEHLGKVYEAWGIDEKSAEGKSITERIKNLADRLYVAGMTIRHLAMGTKPEKPDLNGPKAPIRVREEKGSLTEVSDQGNMVLTAVLAEDELRGKGVFWRRDIENDPAKVAQYLDYASKTHETWNSLDGGIGESVMREKWLLNRGLRARLSNILLQPEKADTKYQLSLATLATGEEKGETDEIIAALREIEKLAGFEPLTVKMGAKATDLGRNEKIRENKYFVQDAEVRLLLIADLAASRKFGKFTFQPFVNYQSRLSYEELMKRPCLWDIIEGRVNPRTYEQALKDAGAEVLDPLDQKDLPKFEINPGETHGLPTLDSSVRAKGQPGGHGQWGVYYMINFTENAPPQDGFFHALFFGNGDNRKGNPEPVVTGFVGVEKIPILKITTPATAIDKKGGKEGVRVIKNNGRVINVLEMFEEIDAKMAGQADLFYAAGQRNGFGQEGKQLFNTNLFYFNIDLLHSILTEMRKIVGQNDFLDAIMPTLFDKSEKAMTIGGKKYVSMDAAIGYVVHNLNTFYSTDPRLEELRKKYGSQILYFMVYDREIFAPKKASSDQYLQEATDYYSPFNEKIKNFTDAEPGLTPPGFNATDSVIKDGKKSDTKFWNESQHWLDSLGFSRVRKMISLTIEGRVTIRNAEYVGEVVIINKFGQTDRTKPAKRVVLSDGDYLNQLKSMGYWAGDHLLLENVRINIADDGSLSVLPIRAVHDESGAVRIRSTEASVAAFADLAARGLNISGFPEIKFKDGGEISIDPDEFNSSITIFIGNGFVVENPVRFHVRGRNNIRIDDNVRLTGVKGLTLDLTLEEGHWLHITKSVMANILSTLRNNDVNAAFKMYEDLVSKKRLGEAYFIRRLTASLVTSPLEEATLFQNARKLKIMIDDFETQLSTRANRAEVRTEEAISRSEVRGLQTVLVLKGARDTFIEKIQKEFPDAKVKGNLSTADARKIVAKEGPTVHAIVGEALGYDMDANALQFQIEGVSRLVEDLKVLGLKDTQLFFMADAVRPENTSTLQKNTLSRINVTDTMSVFPKDKVGADSFLQGLREIDKSLRTRSEVRAGGLKSKTPEALKPVRVELSEDDQRLIEGLYFDIIPWHKVQEVVGRVGGNVRAAHVVLSAIVERITGTPALQELRGQPAESILQKFFGPEVSLSLSAKAYEIKPQDKVKEAGGAVVFSQQRFEQTVSSLRALFDLWKAAEALQGDKDEPVLIVAGQVDVDGLIRTLTNKNSGLTPSERNELKKMKVSRFLKTIEPSQLNGFIAARRGGVVTLLADEKETEGIQGGMHVVFGKELASEDELLVTAIAVLLKQKADQLADASPEVQAALLKSIPQEFPGLVSRRANVFSVEHLVQLAQQLVVSLRLIGKSA
ncbi:MAG: HEAT repeat domain-containing protein [Candidatus Omnitrophota bacterium]|jgi:hypothetical protein